MNDGLILTGISTATQVLTRARVLALRDDAVVVFDDGSSPDEAYACDILTAAASGLQLAPGDAVLVARAGASTSRSIVLGRIDKAPAPAPDPDLESETLPEELTIEAGKSMTLRVGDASITIREDGRILIKGKDLVSHALRMNRIKGGAVAIN
jgi:hypothetical protein